MKKVPYTQSHLCEITIDPHGFDSLAAYIKKLSLSPTSSIIISDEQVFSLYGKNVQKQLALLETPVHFILLPAGEQTKTLEWAERCWHQMHLHGLDRQSLVISLGGGVIGDLAGFVASCYMRGIALLHLPTTLLAMVDSAIGGKNGVNLPIGKNLIGTFYHPKLILIDPRCLQSLSKRDISSGLAEVIKYGVIQDPTLFSYLEENISTILKLHPEKIGTVIAQSCSIKANLVKQDEKEHSIRAILNWGHTFAHAIESLTNYTHYRHGEAVAIGMSCAAYLSHQLGYLQDPHLIQRQDRLCMQVGLPIALPSISIPSLIDLMASDKKSLKGQLSFIIARKLGDVAKVEHVSKEAVVKALETKIHHDNAFIKVGQKTC